MQLWWLIFYAAVFQSVWEADFLTLGSVLINECVYIILEI